MWPYKREIVKRSENPVKVSTTETITKFPCFTVAYRKLEVLEMMKAKGSTAGPKILFFILIIQSRETFRKMNATFALCLQWKHS